MAEALFRSIDCIMLSVDDLEAALEFYCDKLGHKLVWRTDTGAGLAFGDGVTEIVLSQLDHGNETDIKVESAVAAADRFVTAGGSIIAGPFDIAIGKCVVVQDPWSNQLVLLDTSKGLLRTDEDGFVIS
ncbi:MAG: VOC family protein [Armatimonadetes bacterium]|nr:VOC family protein [Armatimonadota bacterium]